MSQSVPYQSLFKDHDVIGYTYNPNLKIRVSHEAGGFLLKTNEFGFRSNGIPKDPEKDVLVFGDSFTAGDGVSNQYRWTDKINTFLPANQNNIIFHNFGLSGTGTDQQYLVWREFASKLKAKCIIVAVLVENIRRNVSSYRPVANLNGEIGYRAKPYFEVDGSGRLKLFNQPVPQGIFEANEIHSSTKIDHGGRFPKIRKTIINFGLKEIVQRFTRYQPLPEYKSPKNYGWRLTKEILNLWCDEIYGPMIIIPIPIYQYIEGTADARSYQKRFKELEENPKISVIDPLPDLLKYSLEERRNFRFDKDVHLTREGHEALAKAVSSPLSEILTKLTEGSSRNEVR